MNSTYSLVLYFVVFFGIMYFLMIRPQQKQAKQRQALLSSLRVKDKVITAGGIYGKITKVKEKSVMVQIADKIEIEVAKSGITSVENRDVVVEKDKKGDKNDKNDKTKNVKAVEEAAPKQTENEEVLTGNETKNGTTEG